MNGTIGQAELGSLPTATERDFIKIYFYLNLLDFWASEVIIIWYVRADISDRGQQLRLNSNRFVALLIKSELVEYLKLHPEGAKNGDALPGVEFEWKGEERKVIKKKRIDGPKRDKSVIDC